MYYGISVCNTIFLSFSGSDGKGGAEPDESVSDPSVPLVSVVLKIHTVLNAAVYALEKL